MKTRDRVVVFRLSQEEYERLKEASSVRGARNLSEFTRSELLTTVTAESLPELVQKGFLEMEHKIAGLQDTVAQLAELLTRSATWGANHDADRVVLSNLSEQED